MRALPLLLLLTGCASGGLFSPVGSVQSGNPILTAASGATTALTIIACPGNPGQVNALQEVINMLTAHGLLVTAEGGGNARLVINACPSGIPSADQIRAMGENQRATRSTR